MSIETHDFRLTKYGIASQKEFNKLLKYYQENEKHDIAAMIQELHDFGMVFSNADAIIEKKTNQITYLCAEPIYSDKDFHMQQLSYYPRYGHGSMYTSDALDAIVERHKCYVDWADSGTAIVAFIGARIWG